MNIKNTILGYVLMAGAAIGGLGSDAEASPLEKTVVASVCPSEKQEPKMVEDYVMLPEEATRAFKTYKVPGRKNILSPSRRDSQWHALYSDLEKRFGNPINDLHLRDVDPLFGFYAFRVHPTRLTPRYHHVGVDLYRPHGTEIKAVFDGKAKVINSALGGKMVFIQHPIFTKDGFQVESYYLHMDRFAKGLKNGQVVKKGDTLGYLGGTGVMEGYFPHLHFGIGMKKKGEKQEFRLDPARALFGPVEKINVGQGKDYTSLTKNVRGRSGNDVGKNLGKLINSLTEDQKRNLPLYVEYWLHAVGKKKQNIYGPRTEVLLKELSVALPCELTETHSN